MEASPCQFLHESPLPHPVDLDEEEATQAMLLLNTPQPPRPSSAMPPPAAVRFMPEDLTKLFDSTPVGGGGGGHASAKGGKLRAGGSFTFTSRPLLRRESSGSDVSGEGGEDPSAVGEEGPRAEPSQKAGRGVDWDRIELELRKMGR
jgi:hypothetical protein